MEEAITRQIWKCLDKDLNSAGLLILNNLCVNLCELIGADNYVQFHQIRELNNIVTQINFYQNKTLIGRVGIDG